MRASVNSDVYDSRATGSTQKVYSIQRNSFQQAVERSNKGESMIGYRVENAGMQSSLYAPNRGTLLGDTPQKYLSGTVNPGLNNLSSSESTRQYSGSQAEFNIVKDDHQ